MDNYRYIDNLQDYVNQNGLQMRQASKFQRVNAMPGSEYIKQYLAQNQGKLTPEQVQQIQQNGAPLSTVASDGTNETNAVTVTPNHYVLNNVGNPNNKWPVDAATFNRKYQPDPQQQGVYMPKGGPMNAVQVNEPISFPHPWEQGKTFNLDKGGYLMQDPNNPSDMYGISGKDFDGTYKFNESKNVKKMVKINEQELKNIVAESVKKALQEWSPERYAQAGERAQKATSGFRGAVNRVVAPKKFQKMKRQGELFNDMAKDHPDDVWDAKTGGYTSNNYVDQWVTLTNPRTGEVRRTDDSFRSCGDKFPIRGKTTDSFLNNTKHYPRKDGWKVSESAVKQTVKLNESQLKKLVAESVKRVLKEINGLTVSQ